MEGSIKKRKVEELPVLPRVLHPLIIRNFDAKILMKMRCVCRLWRDMCWKTFTQNHIGMVVSKIYIDQRLVVTKIPELQLRHCASMTNLFTVNLPRSFNQYDLNWSLALMKPERNLIFIPCFEKPCILKCTFLRCKIMDVYYLEKFNKNDLVLHPYMFDNDPNSLVISHGNGYCRLNLELSTVHSIHADGETHRNDDICTKRDGTLGIIWNNPRSYEIVISPGLPEQKNVLVIGEYEAIYDAGATIGF